MLPIAQATPVGAVDALIILAPLVLATGLVTVDPATSFTGFGEAVIKGLSLAGGLGHMTVGSFAVLALRNRMSGLRSRGARVAFNLPDDLDGVQFVRAVMSFPSAVVVALLKSAGRIGIVAFAVAIAARRHNAGAKVQRADIVLQLSGEGRRVVAPFTLRRTA